MVKTSLVCFVAIALCRVAVWYFEIPKTEGMIAELVVGLVIPLPFIRRWKMLHIDRQSSPFPIGKSRQFTPRQLAKYLEKTKDRVSFMYLMGGNE